MKGYLRHIAATVAAGTIVITLALLTIVAVFTLDKSFFLEHSKYIIYISILFVWILLIYILPNSILLRNNVPKEFSREFRWDKSFGPKLIISTICMAIILKGAVFPIMRHILLSDAGQININYIEDKAFLIFIIFGGLFLLRLMSCDRISAEFQNSGDTIPN